MERLQQISINLEIIITSNDYPGAYAMTMCSSVVQRQIELSRCSQAEIRVHCHLSVVETSTYLVTFKTSLAFFFIHFVTTSLKIMYLAHIFKRKN